MYLLLFILILTIHSLLLFDTSSQTILSKIHVDDLLYSRPSNCDFLKKYLENKDYTVCTYTNEEIQVQKNKSVQPRI